VSQPDSAPCSTPTRNRSHRPVRFDRRPEGPDEWGGFCQFGHRDITCKGSKPLAVRRHHHSLVASARKRLRLVDTVGDINRSIPQERQVRILLGDPPFDWEKATRDEWLRVDRDGFAADLIRREVLAKQRHALVIYGDTHLLRRGSSLLVPRLLATCETCLFTSGHIRWALTCECCKKMSGKRSSRSKFPCRVRRIVW
jgi:hypothetical protein